MVLQCHQLVTPIWSLLHIAYFFFSLSIESDDKVITMCVTCNVSALCLQSDQTLFSHRIASNALQREGHLFTFGEGHSSLEE